MKTSRQRILDYIRIHRAVTASELCAALHTTESNVRHHLEILKQLGLIEVIATRPPSDPAEKSRSARGRPARVYGPAMLTQGSQLGLLTAALLDTLRAEFGAEAQEALLMRAADHLAAAIGESSPEFSDRLTARLFQTVQQLNRLNYQARWEARPDAPRIILGHCPFAALAVDHPEVCLADARLIENFLGCRVEQVQRLARDSRGLPFCMFVLKLDPVLHRNG